MKYFLNECNILSEDIKNIDDLLLSNITSEEPLILIGKDEKYLRKLSCLYGCQYQISYENKN